MLTWLWDVLGIDPLSDMGDEYVSFFDALFYLFLIYPLNYNNRRPPLRSLAQMRLAGTRQWRSIEIRTQPEYYHICNLLANAGSNICSFS